MGNILLCGLTALEYDIRCGASPAEEHAGEIMQHWIETITGEKMVGGKGVIDLHIEEDLTDEEGYSITNTSGKLTIIGHGPRGILYGVYGFLEKYLLVRHYAPGVTSWGDGGSIGELDESFSPVFEYRQDSFYLGEDDLEWRIANRVNTHTSEDPRHGGYMKWAGKFVHTMENITGCPQSQQPCLTDPEVIQKAIQYTRDWLKKDPSVRLVSISQNDNEKYCKCERCAAIDAEEGSHMGTLLRLVNAVAANIKDDYPEVAIETLAYRYTRNIPKYTKPLPNVIIRLCSFECCFTHPLSWDACSRNRAYVKDLEEWNSICDRIYIWDYVTNFANYLAPYPNFNVLRDNMRFYAEHGVKGMYPEGNYQSFSGEFAELRAYMLAKLAWEPMMAESTYQALINGFLEAYYGKGWRNIRAFLDWFNGAAKARHINIYERPFMTVPREMYEVVYDAIESWWDAAERDAGDKLDNVKRSRLQWTYVSLMVRPDPEKARAFYKDVNSRKIYWKEEQHFLPEEQDFTANPAEWNFKKPKQ